MPGHYPHDRVPHFYMQLSANNLKWHPVPETMESWLEKKMGFRQKNNHKYQVVKTAIMMGEWGENRVQM
jgi:hypothetical protein